jgi:histidinol-phosphatase (PHP family)
LKTNFHTHCTFCDGAAPPEKMVEAAIERGFATLGFSSHSDMVKDFAAYKAEIRRLAAKYSDKISVLCGVEAEYDTHFQRGDLDYVIGAVHYVTAPDGARFSVDNTPNILFDGIRSHFKGDSAAFVQAYFAFEREMIATYDCDIVAHVDLVRKFNAKHPYFDESAPWYLAELEKTADVAAASGKLVEVNTGAISRGWLDDAYPSPAMRALLRERGVKFVLSSDSHAPDTIDCAFDRFAAAEEYVVPKYGIIAKS